MIKFSEYSDTDIVDHKEDFISETENLSIVQIPRVSLIDFFNVVVEAKNSYIVVEESVIDDKHIIDHDPQNIPETEELPIIHEEAQSITETVENIPIQTIPDIKEDFIVEKPLDNSNQKFATFDDLNTQYKTYIAKVQAQISALGGGGEVKLRMLDDVARSTIADGLNLQYNATSKKFEFTRPLTSIYSVIRSNNAVLIDSPTPIPITDMTLTPPAGTYLANFNTQFTVDDTSSQTLAAKADLIVLYDQLMALTATGDETVRAGNSLTYGSETLGPGVYIQTGAINVTGDLTLDAGGDPNALFVFRSDGALTTGVGAKVILTGEATSANVWFVTQGAASTAADAIFRGNMLTNQAAVSTGAGTQLEGRMLAINGAPSIDTSILTAPTGTINSSLTLGNVLSLFNMFAGEGAVSNGGISEVQLSVGSNAGAVTGFLTATVGGSIIPSGAGTLSVFRCVVYVDGVIVQDSLRSTSRAFPSETFEFPIVLQTVLTLTEGQTVDVRAYSELGIQSVGPRMSFILTLVRQE